MTDQHVDELGQLVEARLTQEPTQPGDAGIVAQLLVDQPFLLRCSIIFEQLAQPLIGIDDHRAQLQAGEVPAMLADSPMDKDRHPAIMRHDADTDRADYRKKDDKCSECNQYIQQARQI